MSVCPALSLAACSFASSLRLFSLHTAPARTSPALTSSSPPSAMRPRKLARPSCTSGSRDLDCARNARSIAAPPGDLITSSFISGSTASSDPRSTAILLNDGSGLSAHVFSIATIRAIFGTRSLRQFSSHASSVASRADVCCVSGSSCAMRSTIRSTYGRIISRHGGSLAICCNTVVHSRLSCLSRTVAIVANSASTYPWSASFFLLGPQSASAATVSTEFRSCSAFPTAAFASTERLNASSTAGIASFGRHSGFFAMRLRHRAAMTRTSSSYRSTLRNVAMRGTPPTSTRRALCASESSHTFATHSTATRHSSSWPIQAPSHVTRPSTHSGGQLSMRDRRRLRRRAHDAAFKHVLASAVDARSMIVFTPPESKRRVAYPSSRATESNIDAKDARMSTFRVAGTKAWIFANPSNFPTNASRFSRSVKREATARAAQRVTTTSPNARFVGVPRGVPLGASASASASASSGTSRRGGVAAAGELGAAAGGAGEPGAFFSGSGSGSGSEGSGSGSGSASMASVENAAGPSAAVSSNPRRRRVSRWSSTNPPPTLRAVPGEMDPGDLGLYTAPGVFAALGTSVRRVVGLSSDVNASCTSASSAPVEPMSGLFASDLARDARPATASRFTCGGRQWMTA